MELGGKSPILVFDDADIESAIGGAMLGNFYSTGQICSNGTRVFVQRSVHDRFLERLKTRTEAIRLGDPLDPDTASWAYGLKSAARQGAGLYRGREARGCEAHHRRRRAGNAGFRERRMDPADRIRRRQR
jgi:acyl-CoA reductase-like NAD-dependent aldehyde dehydrogenase